MLASMTNESEGLTPAQRVLRAKIAAYASWENTANRAARTEAARKAAHDRFETKVDPEGVMPVEERRQRADAARSKHFSQMAYRSAIARSKGKGKR